MTNAELNKSIAELVYPQMDVHTKLGNNAAYFDNETRGWSVNYCNNMNDLMPLVFGYKLNLIRRRDGSGCAYQYIYDGDDDIASIQAHDKDPQLALAKCLLLVLQAKAKESE